MTVQFPTRQIAKLTGHNGPVHAVTYSAGLGQYILTGSSDRAIRLFNPARVTGTSTGLIQKYEAHGYDVLDIAVTDDNARFASVGGDKTVFLWDVATAQTLRRFPGHGGRCNAVAFGAGDDVLISGSYDGTAKLWDLKSQSTKPLMTLSEAKDSVSALCVVEYEITTGSVDGRVRTYDLRMGMIYVDILGHPVTSIVSTKQGDSLLVSTLDNTIRLFDKASGKLLQAYTAPEYVNTNYRIRSTLGLNDSIVVSGSEDGSIFAWDLLDGSNVKHRLWHDGEMRGKGPQNDRDKKQAVVSAVTFCRTRKEFCSAGGDGSAVVWSTPEA